MSAPYSIIRRLALGAVGVVATGSRWSLLAQEPAAAVPKKASTGRPHTDFIYSQVADGRVLGPDNSRPGIPTGNLSYDFGSAAITVMFRYPAKWSLDRLHYNDGDEEIFVLEGALTINDIEYTAGHYAYLPAGMMRKRMFSSEGATVLTCYSGVHKNYYESAPAGMYDPKLLIADIDTTKMAWMMSDKPELEDFTSGAMRKFLRRDPVTGDQTWLLKVSADDSAKVKARPLVTRSAVHETFVISGEISTPNGVMRSGGYSWRLPNRAYGPLATRTGFTAWYRSKGGPLTAAWGNDSQEIVWNAPYKPDISENMKKFAFKEFDSAQFY